MFTKINLAVLALGLAAGALAGWQSGQPSESELNESAASLCAELGGQWKPAANADDWAWCDIH